MTIGERLAAAGVASTGKVHGRWLTIASSNVRIFAPNFEISQQIDPGTEAYDVRESTHFHFNRPCLVDEQEILLEGATRWRVLKIVDHPMNPTVRVEVDKLP